MDATIKAVQLALIKRGYSVGNAGADGIAGRDTTNAVAKFQATERLPIKYPGTIGPITLAALGLGAALADHLTPPWISEARRFLGLHERKDARALDKALGLDASEISWCGAFVGLIIATALPRETMPVNPLGARNWLKFGRPIPEPQVGAVAVFWRGTKDGWQGHVGTVVGQDATHLHILGGNQSDSVSIARIDKGRLLGYRWPLTYQDPPTAPLPFTTISATVTTNEA